MKIRNSSRITAIVLALMMIVPLISVPAFAEETNVLFTQDFESAEQLTDAMKQQGDSNDSASIKDIGGEHGKVFYYDLTNGPDEAYGKDAASNLILIKNRDSAGSKLIVPEGKYTINADGTVTGYVTIQGTEYKFVNAVLNQQAFDKTTTLYTFVTSQRPVLDESGAPMVENGQIIYETFETLGDAYGTVYYLATGKCVNAICGGTNIAQPSYVKGESNINATEFTVSAQYYISQDWACKMDIRFNGIREDGGADNFELLQVDVPNGNSSNVSIGVHPDIKSEVITNTPVVVAKETWFTLTVHVDMATKSFEAYVNGKLAVEGVDSTSKAVTPLALSAESGNRGWSLGQANRGNNALYGYAGFFMVDNLAIYEGEVIPAATNVPAYLSSLTFKSEEQVSGGAKDTGKYVGFPYAGMAFSYDHSAQGGAAFYYDTNTYPNGAANPNLSNILDKNLFQQNGGVEVKADENGKIAVFEADYFFVPGQNVRIETQLKNVSAENGSATWVTLSFYETKGDRAYFAGVATNLNAVYHNANIPTGKWITISNVVDLETGHYYIYVDGELGMEADLYKNNIQFANITVPKNSGFIAAKLSKMNNMNPTGGSFSKGYTDFILIDNIETYKDLSLLKLGNGFFTEDFEDAYVGKKAVSNNGTVNLSGPSTATYAYAPDGSVAIKLDLIPADAGKTTDKPMLGYGSRGYYVPVEVESFDPADGMDVNLEKLTVAYSGNTTNDKRIYYARVGTTVYVYMASGNAEANADGSNLEYKGTYQIAPANEQGLYDMKYMECFQGGSNIDKMFKAHHPAYTYNSAEGANNTYVFSADYYVAEDAYGYVEAQFYNKYVDLYVLDLANKEFEPRLAAEANAKLIVNAWNTVEVIATLTENDVLFDVYLNGVYTHSTTYSAKAAGINTITANDWIIAKCGKTSSMNTIANLHGSVYVDNISVQPLKADNVKTVEFEDDVLTAIVDGVEVELPNTSGKFYAETVVAGRVFDASVVAELLSTEKVASIRLKAPAGLRFVTKIDLDVLAALEAEFEVVEYGTAIKPVDYNGEALLVPAYKGVYYEGFDQDDTTFHFAGSIVNILEKNMDRDFAGCGYVTLKLTNGATVTLYTEAHVVSVADQAQKTLDECDLSGLTADEIALLEEFAAYAAAN